MGCGRFSVNEVASRKNRAGGTPATPTPSMPPFPTSAGRLSDGRRATVRRMRGILGGLAVALVAAAPASAQQPTA